MHRAIYCSNLKEDCSSFAEVLKYKLENILYHNFVDIVFQAHVHNYERTHLIYDGKEKSGLSSKHIYETAEAPICIVNGHGGSRGGYNSLFKQDLESWHVLGSDVDYGYGRLEVCSKTHVYYEEFSSEKGEVIDHFWVTKTIKLL